ncbi:hypothetical protein CR513_54196, partial [Mucuna pruriens]
MGSGVNRTTSAVSARAYTRNQNKSTSTSGILRTVLAVLFIGFVAWGFQAIQPPPPNLCASRIKLRDGRNLAYKEHGVSKDVAKHKIIFVHGFDACRHDAYVAKTLSPDVTEDLGVYIVSFDRPGYGEIKSLALDIEELADKLDLGSKFYLIGFSLGGQVWSISHRNLTAGSIHVILHLDRSDLDLK